MYHLRTDTNKNRQQKGQLKVGNLLKLPIIYIYIYVKHTVKMGQIILKHKKKEEEKKKKKTFANPEKQCKFKKAHFPFVIREKCVPGNGAPYCSWKSNI